MRQTERGIALLLATPTAILLVEAEGLAGDRDRREADIVTVLRRIEVPRVH